MPFGFRRRSAAIQASLQILIQQGNIIMSALDDLKAADTAVASAIAAALSSHLTEAQTISSLTQQLAALQETNTAGANDAQISAIAADLNAKAQALTNGLAETSATAIDASKATAPAAAS